MEVSLDGATLRRILLALPSERRLSLLDSCGTRGASGSARYLIAGFDPFEIIEVRGDQLLIERRGRRSKSEPLGGNAFSVLAERLARYAVPATTGPVAGACIVTLAYDLVYRIERLRIDTDAARRPPSSEPDAVFAFYDTLIVHDYAERKTDVVGVGGSRRLHQVSGTLLAAAPQALATSAAKAALKTSNFTREQYVAAVRRVKEHILAGDVYQANLTQQFACELDASVDARQIFERLRRDHPAPFAAYIVRRDETVVSASPERFLRVRHVDGDRRTIEAWPIKGTRPRGRDAREDAQLRAELLASGKDRAENVMIVDLLRNDLGRVCRYGSIQVAELCALEEHPSLFHLASRVTGELRDHVAADEILRATFPCGSITGAPKIRAMEIIHAIEDRPRGLSMGAIGYFSFDGSCDLNVAIRTIVVRGRTARFNVGGGIVADSDPDLEYEESLIKARALFRALGTSEG